MSDGTNSPPPSRQFDDAQSDTHQSEETVTQPKFVCPEAANHGNPFRYCPVKGCGWMEAPPPTTNSRLYDLSVWIDEGNAHRDPEARTWGRLAKVGEECGEVIEAFIGVTGQNPRKGIRGTGWDVQEELLDVALTALCAVAHLNNNDGTDVIDLLADKVQRVAVRAGLEAS